MAYHYKLETLLRIRRNFEEQCQLKLAHELFVLENHKKFGEELKGQRQGLVAHLDLLKSQTVSVAMFSFYVEAITNKDRQLAFQRRAIKVQEAVVTEVRKELLEKVKERKIVERLKEKDLIAYEQELRHREQLESDDQVIMRFGHEQ